MKRIYLYVNSCSKSPYEIYGPEKGNIVPYDLGDGNIFFGSCKCLMRQRLYNEFLFKEKRGIFELRQGDIEICIVGINGNAKEKRIIWAGR